MHNCTSWSGLLRGRLALSVALLLTGITTFTLASGQQQSSGSARTPQSTPTDAGPAAFATHVNQTLGYTQSRIVSLNLDATPGLAVDVPIELEGQMYTLHLEPHSVRGPGYQVLVQGADGRLTPINPEPVRTLRGSLMEWPGSRAAGSMFEQGLQVLIWTPDGTEYGVEFLIDRVPGAAPGQHVIYRASDVIGDGGTCGVKNADRVLIDQGGGGIAGGVTECADLACDADFEYYQDHGSNVATVQTQVNNVTNTMNTQYENEVQIAHLIGTIIVRSAEPDPYTSTDADTLLTQFRSEWNANQTAIVRDVAELFTGKQIDGSTIGVAWGIGVVCDKPNAYCFVQSDFNGSMTCKTDLSAHELGHCWGAFHCDCADTTMFPSIQCANTFDAESIADINGYKNTESCFGPCETGTATLPFTDNFPTTTIDTAKWIGIDGATSNTTASGTSEPSAPNSLDLDGSTLGGDQVRSAIMNTLNVPTLTLEYWYERRGGGDSPESGDDLVVEYVASNGLWTELHRQLGSGADMTNFAFVTTDLPADAKHKDFRLRFRAISSQVGSDDWFVDNVNLFAVGFQANDNCANAAVVAAGSTPFSTIGTTTDGPAEATMCNFQSYTNIDFDIWYLYTAQCNGTASIGLCGSDFDSKLAVYSASCPPASGPPIVCANNTCGDDPQLNLSVAQGTTYRIRVGGTQDKFGTGTLTIACFPAPTNDNCANAIAVAAGNTPFSTIGTSIDGPAEPTMCNFGGYNNIDFDIWYLYTAQCTGTATIGLCGADFDSKLAVYNSLCPPSSGPPIACANNVCGDDAQTTFPVTFGTTYRLRVGGILGKFGTGTLSIVCNGVTPPPCPADLAPGGGNSVVDVDDLLFLINSWGACGNPNNCPADIEPPGGNDIVDVDDLLKLINSWGPCI